MFVCLCPINPRSLAMYLMSSVCIHSVESRTTFTARVHVLELRVLVPLHCFQPMGAPLCFFLTPPAWCEVHHSRLQQSQRRIDPVYRWHVSFRVHEGRS